MKHEALKRVMEALANVAEAVKNLRALFPAGNDIVDEVAEKVTEVADWALEDAMLGEVGSPERTGAIDECDSAAARKAGLLPVSAKPKKAKAPKAPKPAPKPETPPPAPAERKGYSAMGVCIICGESYLKTSNVQKRCPACRDAKIAGKTTMSPASAPSADPSDRLSRIKAIDKKLDTIPE